MKFFNLDNPVFRVAGKIIDSMILSILWFIGSIPIVTIGASSNAIYETFVHVVIRDEGRLLPTFWGYYKYRFSLTILETVLFEVLILLNLAFFIAGFMYFEGEEWIGAVFLVLMIFCLVIIGMAIMCFFLLRSTNIGLTIQLKISFVFTIKYIPYTFIMTGALVGVFIAAEMFMENLPLLITILPVTYVWICSYMIEHIAEKHTDLIKRTLPDAEKVR